MCKITYKYLIVHFYDDFKSAGGGGKILRAGNIANV
jgi:hypothetical protein